MRRLAANLRLDFRLQVRNGFYHAVAFVLVCWFVALAFLPAVDWAYVLPVFVFGNLLMVNFYFIAGLFLLERAEGTLAAQAVTPLSGWEYLSSKALTLAALSVVEQVVIVWSAHGAGFSAAPLLGGVLLASFLYALVGFLAVARYRTINEYLMPSVLYTLVLALPAFGYLGIWDSWVLYLHPFSAPIVLLAGAFGPIPDWQWAYGVLFGLAWVGLLLVACRRVFDRQVVAADGGH